MASDHSNGIHDDLNGNDDRGVGPSTMVVKEEAADSSADLSGLSAPSSYFDGVLASPTPARESMYPVLLGEMLDTVLEHEAFLFSDDEVAILRHYQSLPYPSRYIFSRLIQRKDGWLRLEALRTSYRSEVSEIEEAVEILTSIDKPRLLITHAEAGQKDQEAMLSLLTLDELKTLAKRMHTPKAATTKASIITALLTTKSQGTLSSMFAPSSPGRRKSAAAATANPSPSKISSPNAGSKGKQLSLNFTASGRMASQSVKLANEVTNLLGSLVRVAPETRSLIDRVALVFYRGTMLGGTALTTAVLSRSRRRNYPIYKTKRSIEVFASRDDLLAFEEAVSIEFEMEEILQWGDNTEATYNKALQLFESIWPKWKATVERFDRESPQGPDRMTYHRMRFHAGWPQTRVVYKGCSVLARFKLHAREEEVLRALLGQRHFRRGKRGEWYDRLALITAMYSYPDSKVKGKTEALAIAVRGIEDPDTHLIYHDQLQRRITRLENQLPIPKSQKHDFSYAKLKQCTERTYYGVRLDYMDDGYSSQQLLAPLSPSRPSSPQKTAKGEIQPLDSPEGSRFTFRAPMRKIVKVERASSTGSGKQPGMLKRSGSSSSDLLASRLPSPTKQRPGLSPSPSLQDLEGADEAILAQYEVARKESRTSMASVWRGLDGQACRVEDVVLQQYQSEGWSGFHDEGGCLKMLFALCLWDIIFDDSDEIADVFETPYQRAPLDMGQDSFCITRGPSLRARLDAISQGGAPALVAAFDERERPRSTWAIGCRWDSFTREDLLSVSNCIPGPSLAIIFQMMAEEWEHCSGGMPDLLIYRTDPSPAQVRLCEVKSINDRLSETQKVWIDVLLRAGVAVEVSLVRDSQLEGGTSGSLTDVKSRSRSVSVASAGIKREGRDGSQSPVKMTPSSSSSWLTGAVGDVGDASPFKKRRGAAVEGSNGEEAGAEAESSGDVHVKREEEVLDDSR